MRRSRALIAGGVLAGLAAGVLYRRIGFREPERAELQFEDGSTVLLAGSPEVDVLAAHARGALATARGR